MRDGLGMRREKWQKEEERMNEFVLLDHINIESSDYGKRAPTSEHPTAISMSSRRKICAEFS